MTEFTLQEALAEVGKWGRIVKVFDKVSDAAQALGGLEQLVTERKSLADSLQSQLDTLALQLAAAQRDLDDARAAQQATVKAATRQADEKRQQAEAVVADIVAKGNEEVAGLVAQVAAARDELAELLAQKAGAAAELADIHAKIAAAREQARKLLEG